MANLFEFIGSILNLDQGKGTSLGTSNSNLKSGEPRHTCKRYPGNFYKENASKAKCVACCSGETQYGI